MAKSNPVLVDNVERNPRQHRLAELRVFEELLREVLGDFLQDETQRKTDEEDDVFRELLKEGIELEVITIQIAADAALTDASAAGRWVKGDTAPAKRKQVKILREMLDRVGRAKGELERKSRELQHVLDAIAATRETRQQEEKMKEKERA